MCVQLQKGNFCLWAYKAFPNRQKPSKCHFIVENVRSKWVGAIWFSQPLPLVSYLQAVQSLLLYGSPKVPKFCFAFFLFKITISLGSTLAIHLHSSLHDSATLSHVSGLTVPQLSWLSFWQPGPSFLSYSYISFNLNPTHLQNLHYSSPTKIFFLWKPIALGVSTTKLRSLFNI